MRSIFVLLFLLINAVLGGSPTGGYAPGRVTCPSDKVTRSALEGIGADEKSYIDERYKIAKSEMTTFLKNANMSDFDVDSFMEQYNPTIGIAFSGGGYRAMLSGAGNMKALDSRAKEPSVLGGILQSASYMVGLSGGAWLTGSVASNDFISVDDALDQGKLWNLKNSLLTYNGILGVISNAIMWTKIDIQVKLKFLFGSTISITDLYGRALSYQLLANTKDQGDAFTLSDVTSQSKFKSYEMPYPILVALGREPNEYIMNFNSTVFELAPYEMGSWDPSLRSFMQTKYLGSSVDDGTASGKCINGFDNAGFLMGTSSSIFNGIMIAVKNGDFPRFIKSIINTFIVDPIQKANVDIAHYNPNPFYKKSNPDGKIAKSKELYLTDGSFDGQNVPFLPLVHRNVSVIFSYDQGDETSTNWPDGSAIIKTYERQFSNQGKDIAFPYVPDQNTFRNLNLTSRPTFFGCDAKNLTSLTENIYDVPLVIYNANRPFSYWSNTSIIKLKYSNDERNGMIQNGYDLASRKNGELDSEFAACVGCAIIRREQERQGIEQTEQCKQCFAKYCWDGTVYEGESLGDNFSDEGLTSSTEFYNSSNVKGINDGAADIV